MRGLEGPDVAEHVIVGAHRVVVHKQLASEGFVVEVAGEVAHLAFEIVALADDVPGEVTTRVMSENDCAVENGRATAW